MAMTARATAILKSLAERGDSFARHVLSIANKRDVSLLSTLAKRGDVLALKHRDGVNADVMVKAQVNSWAAAGDYVSTGLNALTGDKVAQVITFAQPAGKTFGGVPFALSATGGASGLPVTFSKVSGPCTLSGSTVTITGAGAIVIAANQAGNDNYSAATEVRRTITVAKAVQTLTFAPKSPVTVVADSPMTLSATGGASGAPVVFAYVSGPATLDGVTLTLTGPGAVVVTANQAAGANHAAAPQVSRTLTVTA